MHIYLIWSGVLSFAPYLDLASPCHPFYMEIGKWMKLPLRQPYRSLVGNASNLSSFVPMKQSPMILPLDNEKLCGCWQLWSGQTRKLISCLTDIGPEGNRFSFPHLGNYPL
ncbi:hypothetical protein F5Y16DRAFT_298917 [Xylariaceae sp. FL0255]|nr:hypothetical protein F5Y16DRAFT_298917 [Xylariaceae sp. FL0255]